MSFKTIPTSGFEKEIKKLAKKYKTIKPDLLKLIDEISQNPFSGDSLGNNCYKVRMAISDKRKGKSAGARVIINVQIISNKIYLLSIYDKSTKANLDPGELDYLIKGL